MISFSYYYNFKASGAVVFFQVAEEVSTPFPGYYHRQFVFFVEFDFWSCHTGFNFSRHAQAPLVATTGDIKLKKASSLL